ncbi:MAG: hypothetical protein JWN13_7202 [Betaproteobacteria bacterium]|jgi:hypothetical protein|nr:hypothetical protein [Betaproteobacteria bacterium]MEA3157270.1 hypothetical protein [Betaproteobacteria bacterium]
MANDITLEDVRRMAADVGLTRLTDQHLQELLRATKTAQARRASMPKSDLTPANESAHVFRLDKRSDR